MTTTEITTNTLEVIAYSPIRGHLARTGSCIIKNAPTHIHAAQFAADKMGLEDGDIVVTDPVKDILQISASGLQHIAPEAVVLEDLFEEEVFDDSNIFVGTIVFDSGFWYPAINGISDGYDSREDAEEALIEHVHYVGID